MFEFRERIKFGKKNSCIYKKLKFIFTKKVYIDLLEMSTVTLWYFVWNQSRYSSWIEFSIWIYLKRYTVRLRHLAESIEIKQWNWICTISTGRRGRGGKWRVIHDNIWPWIGELFQSSFYFAGSFPFSLTCGLTAWCFGSSSRWPRLLTQVVKMTEKWPELHGSWAAVVN